MTKKKTHNPLSYLGWLGLVGIVGICTGDFIFQLFLFYFFFFIYRNMPADELFWINVRKAGFNAFIFSVIMNSILLTIIAVFDRIRYFSESAVTYIIRTYAISFFVAMGIFIIMLWRINRREKRYMEE